MARKGDETGNSRNSEPENRPDGGMTDGPTPALFADSGRVPPAPAPRRDETGDLPRQFQSVENQLSDAVRAKLRGLDPTTCRVFLDNEDTGMKAGNLTLARLSPNFERRVCRYVGPGFVIATVDPGQNAKPWEFAVEISAPAEGWEPDAARGITAESDRINQLTAAISQLAQHVAAGEDRRRAELEELRTTIALQNAPGMGRGGLESKMGVLVDAMLEGAIKRALHQPDPVEESRRMAETMGGMVSGVFGAVEKIRQAVPSGDSDMIDKLLPLGEKVVEAVGKVQSAPSAADKAATLYNRGAG